MKKIKKYSRREVLRTSASITSVLTIGAGFPSILKAENNIKVGIPTILSGRVAQLGISVTNAIKMSVNNFNNAGGLDGRNIELIIRDSRSKPDEAARVCRNFINSDKVDGNSTALMALSFTANKQLLYKKLKQTTANSFFIIIFWKHYTNKLCQNFF